MYTIIWTEQKKKEAIEALTKYFSEHGSGESIMQSDSGQIDGLELLCEIADNVLGEDGIGYDDED